ncbi:MAG: transporter substrate-binding domain-containing protein, partial [Acidobacteriota bacterium]
ALASPGPILAQASEPVEPSPARPALIVGIDADVPPYAFRRGRNEADGLVVDLARATAEILEVELHWRFGSPGELRAALEAGEVDVLAQAPYTEALEERFALTLPHTDIVDGVFVRSSVAGPAPDQPFDAWLEDQTVVTLPDSPAQEWLGRQVPTATSVTADTIADALRRLAAGEADVALIARRSGVSIENRLGLDQLRVLPLQIPQHSHGLSFAVRAEDEKLRDDLDRALVLLTANGRYLDLYDRWQRDPTDHSALLRFAAWAVTPVLGLLLLSMIWTFALRRTVARRTADLEREMAERRRLEDQVRQAQKLESLGVLAGGIAHDFNNLLTVIQGNAALAKIQVPAESSVLKRLDRIEDAGRRAADLTRQMLAYSGRGQFVTEAIDLSALVHETRPLRESLVSKKATLIDELAEDLPPVIADPTQLRQLVVQLVVNASEALDERPGKIRVRTGVRHCSREELERTYLGEPMTAGEYVFLEVEDDGKGMDQATISRIFEPFFSTKFTGRGLGLAATLGIVRGHGGAITVDSSTELGATFSVYFPAALDIQPANDAVVEAQPVGGSPGTVLVVDDEDEVRRVVREILEDEGLRVLDAPDGEAGVKVFKAYPEVRVVVLDATMPRMDGAETYERLRRLRPDVRVVLASGYDERQAVGTLRGPQLASFLAKPFEPEALIEAVRAAAGTEPGSEEQPSPSVTLRDL